MTTANNDAAEPEWLRDPELVAAKAKLAEELERNCALAHAAKLELDESREAEP